MKSIYLAVAGLAGMIGLGVIVYTMTSQPPTPKLQDVVRPPQVDDRRQEAINNTDSWQNYRSSLSPFTFKYPPHSIVRESLKGMPPESSEYDFEFLSIGGLGASNEHSSWIRINSSPRKELYNPPAGTEVEQWVLHNPKYPFETEYYKVSGTRMIGGLKAVHLIGKHYGHDDYRLIKGNRLYQILLYHGKETPNQTIYDTFLDSISFTTK